MSTALDPLTPEGFDYYDLDAIAAEEATVPAMLPAGATGVGAILDPSADAPDLPPGAALELPLWLAPAMARRQMARVGLPPAFGDRMRRRLRAGPGVEDLRARCPHFYAVAARAHAAMEAAGTGDDSLPPFIAATFVGRYRELLTRAPVLESATEASRVAAKLTVEEAALFHAAEAAAAAHDRWRANREAPGAGGKRKHPGGGQENRGP
jgi:GINS complex subunit 3